MKMSDRQLARFWSRVSKTDGCWEWIAGTMDGYGWLRLNGKSVRAHRVSWELSNGPIPNGFYVCHRCDNRKCVNPAHMFLGTHADNMTDMVQKKRHRTRGPKQKLTPETVRELRSLRGKYSHRELAARFGIAPTYVTTVMRGQTWGWVAPTLPQPLF